MAGTHEIGVVGSCAPHCPSLTHACNLLQALVRWGGALLELAHYKNGAESTDMIQEVGSWGSVTQAGRVIKAAASSAQAWASAQP